MIEIDNFSKIDSIFKSKGFLTRSDINKNNINPWFLYEYTKREHLIKIAPGFYAKKDYLIDELFILQNRYPKYIFNSYTALYLNHLIDVIPSYIYISKPQNYHPTCYNKKELQIRSISNNEIYQLGITDIKTIHGNTVRCYDKERCICDIIKYRDKYDSETFIKSIKNYIRVSKNNIKLYSYAKKLKIEKKVAEVMELLLNEN